MPFVGVEPSGCLTVVILKLVTLPRSPTVAEILDDFQEFVLSQNDSEYANHIETTVNRF